jgi:hypothetical protein
MQVVQEEGYIHTLGWCEKEEGYTYSWEMRARGGTYIQGGKKTIQRSEAAEENHPDPPDTVLFIEPADFTDITKPRNRETTCEQKGEEGEEKRTRNTEKRRDTHTQRKMR